MPLYESGEDYLEAVLKLSKTKPDVHSVDVARELGVSKPAVTKALKILSSNGYIEFDGNHIHLTEEGGAYAERIYQRHQVITKFFLLLGVSRENAETDACRMEHDISDESFAAIEKYIKDNE